ncbi:MAG: mobile mystery protein B [Micavibrio aeruginosavorus]|uniref:Mobile mystery protein B n=1 Tax=Micavibrio aeruginosavorus TaxID=349221 RepID=A0A2W5HMD6_9BACT|nr:MAG: mobile mystery protein B [Micavibrio aeruginosavorus]
MAGVMYSARPGETPLDDLSGLKLKIPNVTRRQLDEAEAANIRKAISRYSGSHKVIRFDTGFFNKLHKQMFGDVWKWAGEYRTTATNIGSPPVHILQDLIILQKNLEVRPHDLETGVWLHHRAVQIHPYQGGNGRWSRFLSDLWLQRHIKQTINWPVGMEQESPVREIYLTALREADRLNYKPLVELHEKFSSAQDP